MPDLISLLAEALPYPLAEDELTALAQAVYDELEMRTGTRIYDAMPESASAAFMEAIDAGEEAIALQILATECPNHQEITAEETRRVIADTVVRIVASGAGSAAESPVGGYVPGEAR